MKKLATTCRPLRVGGSLQEGRFDDAYLDTTSETGESMGRLCADGKHKISAGAIVVPGGGGHGTTKDSVVATANRKRLVQTRKHSKKSGSHIKYMIWPSINPPKTTPDKAASSIDGARATFGLQRELSSCFDMLCERATNTTGRTTPLCKPKFVFRASDSTAKLWPRTRANKDDIRTGWT